MKDERDFEVMVETCSVEQNEVLSGIFCHINDHCFDNQLDPALLMLTFSRTSRVIGGHFSPNRWTANDDEEIKVHEIALNANIMQSMSITEFLKILAHEMVHFWQWEHGSPGRKGYHNKEWGQKMLEIGLEPINPMTGKVETSGQSMTNGDFTENSKLERALRSLPEDLTLPFTADPDPEQEQQRKNEDQGQRRGGTRAKFTCPACGLNMWGRFGARVLCMDCNEILVENTGERTKE